MLPDWPAGIWLLVFYGGNAAYAVGLFLLWAVMTYFFGKRTGEGSVWVMGIPLWTEILGLAIAALVVCGAALVVVVLALCSVFFAIWAPSWVLTWPWRYRYQRLFREYIGFDSRLAKRSVFSGEWSKYQRRVDRRLRALAITLQDALDRLEAAGERVDTWSLRGAVGQARKSFRLAQKAARERWFWVKPSHLDYLPKRRKEKIVRRLQAVS